LAGIFPLPIGIVFDLPFSFIGKAFGEPELLAIADSYDQISKNSVPKFLKRPPDSKILIERDSY